MPAVPLQRWLGRAGWTNPLDSLRPSKSGLTAGGRHKDHLPGLVEGLAQAGVSRCLQRAAGPQQLQMGTDLRRLCPERRRRQRLRVHLGLQTPRKTDQAKRARRKHREKGSSTPRRVCVCVCVRERERERRAPPTGRAHPVGFAGGSREGDGGSQLALGLQRLGQSSAKGHIGANQDSGDAFPPAAVVAASAGLGSCIHVGV